MAKNETLQIDQYGKLEATVTVSKNGVVLSLVGWSAKMQIRASKNPTSPVLAEYSTVNGYLTIAGSAGQILIDVPGSQTQLLYITSGLYDLYAINPGGESFRVMQGNVLIDPSITRPLP